MGKPIRCAARFPDFNAFARNENTVALYIFAIPSLFLTGLFVAYEILQMTIQKVEYIKDFWNWLDFIRLGLIFFFVISKLTYPDF